MYFILKHLRATALLLFFFTWTTTIAFAQNEADILATSTVIVADDGNGLLDIGESLQITLSVVPEGTVPNITGVQFVLNFDPAILQVAGNPTPGPSINFTNPSPIPFDNTNGTITFLGGNFSGIPGTFEVMTFTVNAIAGSVGTAITFDYTAIPAPKVTSGSTDYIGDTPDIVVAVNDPNPNTPPLVSVVSPQQGTDGGGVPTYQDVRFPSGSTIPLVADATDSDGTITAVEFFDAADNSLGTGSLTTGTKYQFNLTNALVGAFSFKATATDNGGAMGTSGLSDLITVFERTQVIPGLVEAENFTAQSGSILTQDNGGNDAGGLHIGFIENNSSTTYEVSVANNVTYDVVVRAASNSTGGTITFKDASNNTLGSIAVANTGGGQAYQDFTGQVTFATSGVQDLTLEYTGGATFLFNLNSVSFSEAANVPPTISGIPNQVNDEGDVVSLDLSPFAADSDGTIASYELTSGTLPDGLSLNTTTGLISGTLSAISADNSPYSLTINVRDNTGDLSTTGSSFTWTVNEIAVNNPPTIDPVATQEFTEGDFVVVPIQVNDDNNPAASVAIYDISAFGTNNPFTPGATVPTTDYTLTDNGNGSYLLEWNTGAGDGRAYEVRVTANDGVNPPVTAAFDLNIGQPIPGTVQANTLKNPDPWYGTGIQLPYTVAIENNAVNNIGFINAGDVIDYLVDVAEAGNYILTLRAAKGSPGSTQITFSESGAGGTFNSLGFVLVPTSPDPNPWQNYFDFTTTITLTNAGLQTVRLSFNGTVNVDYFSLAPAPDNNPPVITLTPAGNQTMAEGETLVIDLAVSDPDGNIQNNTTVTGPSFLTQTPTTDSATDYASTLSFSPITGDAGVYTVTVTTNDGVNPAVTTTFQVTVTPPVLPCDVKYRVNAAGPVIAGSGGDDWQADLTYVTSGGSNTFSTSATINNATAYPTALFQTERFQPNMNDLVYAFPVVPGGEYEVRLLHAEIFSQETNVGSNRIFDVLIEGVLVEDDYRVYTAAGNNLFTAVVESYTVTVNDNLLDIVLSPVNQNAAIKAIEICTISEPNVTTYTITATAGANGSINPSGAVTVVEGSNQSFAITPDPGYAVADVLVDGVSVGAVTSYEFTNVLADATIDASFALAPFEAIYVNAGGGAYTAQDGRVFAADNGFTGGSTYPTAGSAAATNLAGIDFANTQDDQLFRTERNGDFSYSFAVPDGDYIVELFFAEIFHGITGGSSALPGERIFDVSIEGGSSGLTALDLLDPEAGGAFDPATGLVKSFAVTVSDGALDIALSTTIDNAKINALCIREDDGSLNAPPTFDPVAGTTVTEGDQAVVAFSAMDDNAVTTYALQLVNATTGVEVDPADYIFNFMTTGGTVEWNTTVGDAGNYTGTLLAFDGLDVSSTTFSVTVEPLSYTITAGAGANGTITPSGAVTVPAGTDQTFNFTPDPGFTVAQILVDGTPVATAAEYTFSNVQADATIQVSFSEGNAPPTVTITAPADGITVVRGADITFEATATDPEEGDISAGLNWSSSDPQFNVATTGPSVIGKLRAVGVQTVTASVFDNGLLGTDEISLTVPPPAISFAAPAEGANLTGPSVTVEMSTIGLLLDDDEHFHFYINPADPNNPDYDDRISTIDQSGQTTFTFDAADGIVLGANTIVAVAATSSHVEFTNDSARDVVNFNVEPNTDVFLTIDPAVTNVNVNDIFTVDILLEANDQEVNGAQAFIDYDPTVLKALSITAGSTFGFTLTQVIDNSAGEIDFAAGSTGTTNLPSGTFVLATVQFEAIGGPTSTLSFNTTSPRETKVTAAGSGNSILTGVNGGVVNVVLGPGLVITPDPITATAEAGATTMASFVVESNNNTTLPSAATLTLTDDNTGLAPTWASTVATADQGTTYQVQFDATGLPFGTYNATLTASGVSGYEDVTASVTLVVQAPAMPMALFEITPGSGIGGTTFGGTDKFQLTNQSSDGLKITKLTIDLSTGILPDMVFDPTGSGGDASAQCFDPNTTTAATVGLVSPTNPCVDPFSQPRQGGFDIISMDFTDFDPGEFFSFSVDVDPNSIQGVPNAGAAGAVSGLELAGATVTITFENGDVLVSNLYEDGSFGGSQSVSPTTLPAPAIAIQGVSPTPATVGNQNQTVLVSGEPNAFYSILLVDARLYIASGNPPFNVPDPTYYANEAVNKVVYNGQLDASGSAAVPVTLLLTPGLNGTPDGGLNHFLAVQSPTPYAVDQPVSPTSNAIILKYDPDFVSCNIISAVPGTQTCEGGGYSQEITITYDGNGNGDLMVNGQTFTPTGSPQTITLTGLVADGQPVDLTVSFPDATGDCDFFQAAAFTAPIVPTYTVTGTNPTSCLGAEGSLLISGLQADTDYEVSIDGGANSVTLAGNANGEILISTLASGQYDVIVALNQCGGATQTVVLMDPNAPTYTVSGSDPTGCGVNDGSITISGLLPNTMYSVDLGTGAPPMVFTTNEQGEHVLAGLGADDYSIVVTTLTKCAGMAMPVTLSAPAGLAFAATGSDPTTCEGMNGSILISGLTPAVVYSVDIGDGDGASSFTADTGGEITVPGLSAGSYSVVVSLNGCSGTPVPVSLADPAAPTYSASGTNPTTCGDDNGSITIAGLQSNTLYSVNIGNGPQSLTSDGTGAILIEDLTAGAYSVVVSLANCTGTAVPVSLADPDAPEYTVNGTDPTTCGGNDGMITISGLTSGEAYQVDLGTGGSSQAYPTDANGQIIIDNLAPETYTVTVSLLGCVGTSVVITLSEPGAPTYAATGTDPAGCASENGSISITGLTPNANYAIDINDGSGFQAYTSNGTGEVLIDGLPGGGYTVVVSQFDCAGTPIPITLLETPALTYAATGTNPTGCGTDDGSITISGLPPSTSYSVDLNDGNGSQSLTSDTEGMIMIADLGPNIYSVVVSQNGCDGAAQVVTLSEPNAPTYAVVGTNPTGCEEANGSILISGLNAAVTYSVNIGDGGGFQSLTSDESGEILIDGLPGGNYSVVAELNDCSGTTFPIVLFAPTTPSYTAIGTDPTTCEGADGAILISGLTAEAEYQVDLGDVSGPQTFTSDVTGAILIGGLAQGNYTVVVSQSGCVGSAILVALADPEAPTYTAVGADPTVCEGDDGYIIISGLEPGTAYQVDLGDGNGIQPLTSDGNGEIFFGDLTADTYTVIVNNLNCGGVAIPVTLSDPPTPTYTVIGTNPSGCDSSDGSITISGLPANTDYSVNIGDGNGLQTWTSDANGQIIISSLDGEGYIVTVTLNGCNGISIPITLTEPDAPTYTAVGIGPTGCATDDGFIVISGLNAETDFAVNVGDGNGAQPYSSDVNGEIVVPNLFSGDYSVVVSFNGCTGIGLPVTLMEPDSPTYTTTGSNPTFCGGTNGSITISGLDADTDYAVDIMDGSGMQSYTSDANGNITLPNLSAGSYEVFVTLSTCTGEGVSIVLSNPVTLNFTVLQTNPTVCGAMDGVISIAGLQPGTEYLIDLGDGDGAQSLTTDANGEIAVQNLPAGAYSVVITLNDCVSEPQLLTLVEDAGVVTDIAVASDATCDSDGIYSQSLIVTYQTPPAMSMLIVNGQSFVPTGSPQTIVLTGLTADGAAVNVTAYFDGTPDCVVTKTALFTALAIPDYTVSLLSGTPCGSSSGEILLSGLTPNTIYAVSVDGGAGFTEFLSSSTGEIVVANLFGGDYSVIASSNFCDGPAIPIFVPNTDPVTYSVSSTSPTSCDEGGLIELTGLIANQTYLVSVGNGVPDADYTADASGTITVEGLLSGIYTVSASANGCAGDTFTVEIFNVPEIDIDYIPGAAAPTGCGTNDGVIMLIGLLPNTEYTIDYGPVVQLTSNAAGMITVSTDLGPGTYVLTAFLGSCAGPTLEITLSEPGIPTFAAEQVPGPNGLAILLSGLNAMEDYLVDLGTGQAPQTYQSDANGEILLDGLAEGDYSITVALNECTSDPVDISLLDSSTLLSVEVVEPGPFGAVVENDHEVLLNWTTDYEYDNDYFEIQRSIDGTHYHPIGRVDAVGYSTSRREYAYVDPGATRLDAPRLYYRLQQFKFDGSHRFSTVASTPIEAWKGEFRLLYLDMGILYRVEEVTGVGITTLEIYTINGQLVGRDTYDRLPNVDLRTDHLAEGVYVVIANGTFREKIVIVR